MNTTAPFIPFFNPQSTFQNMSTDVAVIPQDPVDAQATEVAQKPTHQSSESTPDPTPAPASTEPTPNDVATQDTPIQSDAPTSTQQEAPATTSTPPPKLNPSATEFISRSSSTGPADGGKNSLGSSRHARGSHRARGSARPATNASGNPVVLANAVEGTDVNGMTGFKTRPVREPRPPRGYVPPAPERKVSFPLSLFGSKECADGVRRRA